MGTSAAETSPERRAQGDLDIASVGALVADPARCRILLALSGGGALPAARLAAIAGISAATASGHLGRLTSAGLLTVEAHGRYRHYSLAGPEIGDLIEALERLAPMVPVRSLRQSRRTRAERVARTCYDHLAGQLGVDVMQAMVDGGRLTASETAGDREQAAFEGGVTYVLTEQGKAFLDELGVRLPEQTGPLRHHLDSTEQRPHLTGALGRGLLERFLALEWLERSGGTRAVRVTEAGHQGFIVTFGIRASA